MPFKTPSPQMAGFIALVLLALFSISYLAPALNVSWLKSDAKFDAALQQTLLVLLVGAVAYYLGSTRDSAAKNEVIATQATTAAAVVAAAGPAVTPAAAAAQPLGTVPTGTAADPVAVVEVPPPTA